MKHHKHHKHVLNKPIIKSFFSSESANIVNGQVVQDSKISSSYDGKQVQLHRCENDRCNNYQLKDKALVRLLSKNLSKNELIDRLNRNYSLKTQNNRHRRKQHRKTQKKPKRPTRSKNKKNKS